MKTIKTSYGNDLMLTNTNQKEFYYLPTGIKKLKKDVRQIKNRRYNITRFNEKNCRIKQRFAILQRYFRQKKL